MLVTIPDFAIPTDKDQLLVSEPGKYSVKKIFPLKELQDVITDTNPILQAQGPSFILDHFDEFFSIIVHGTNVNLQTFVLGFERIYKCLDMFVNELDKEFDRKREPRPEDKPPLLTINKMLAYLLCNLVRHIEVTLFHDINSLQTKRKKNADKSDLEHKWHDHTDRVLVLIYHWVSLPLEKLWQPPIAEANFIMSVADICYRILERLKNARDKPVRESIFQILGILVQKYNHSMSCVIKMVQLVKMSDGLAPHLASGIVQLIEETQCTGMVNEILREIDRAKPEEGGTRNIGIFLEGITSFKPELMLPAIDNLTEHLANECYLMRNCVIGILGTVVREVLTSEELSEEKKTKRDECLGNLMEHLLDLNTYVRSKTVQVWQNLADEGAVPLANQNELLGAAIRRIEDKSPVVRKHAYHLLKTLLKTNPFAGKFEEEELTNLLKDAKNKLKTLKRRIVSLSEPGATTRSNVWNHLAPTIQETISSMPVEESSQMDTDEDPQADAAYESVRQLLLGDKIEEALQLLLRINSGLAGVPSIKNMTAEAREEYLISLLYKIFMDSQEAGPLVENEGDGDTDKANKLDREMEKRKTAYKSQAAVVDYMKNWTTFANQLTTAIPRIEARLCSSTPSDAIEACSFLGMAYQFKVKGTKEAMCRALCQAFYPDESVCENMAETYKQIYIGEDEQYQSDRQRGLVVVKALTRILRKLQPGESSALSKLVTIWRAKEVIGTEVLQVMWERFSLKLPETTPEDSRAALMLLTMAASEEPLIIKGNLDVLLTRGLGPRSETDLLLARDTCRAIIKIQLQHSDPLKCPSRLPNNHEIFQKLISLLVTKFPDVKESCYTSFSIDAINAIYHMADQPTSLMKELLIKLEKNFKPAKSTINKKSLPTPLLANFFNIIGHIAIKEMVHLDVTVYKELKRRDTVMEAAKEKKKGGKKSKSNTSSRNLGNISIGSATGRPSGSRDDSTREDCGEQALEGATADDSHAEFIQHVLEHEVVTGKGLLAKFVPLVCEVCEHPEKYKEEQLQIAAALALSKMMCVSSVLCKEWLRLLITIMERTPFPSSRSDILVGLTDMMNRFPNDLEPWTSHIFGRLKDNSPMVRRTCVKMLTSLIMKEMIRVKGQVSDLVVCLVDSDMNIRLETTQFFKELANKGNTLYNVIPDILSRLTAPGLNLEEDKFQEIIKFILGLVQKEKQVDSIIDKVCVRFKLATSERQWRDLSYCLSLLKFNTKGLHRLTAGLTMMKDKVHYDPVLKVLQDIINQAKKKPETKEASVELEERLEQLFVGNDEKIEKQPDVEAAVMPPPAPLPRVTRARSKRRNV